jgi:hypothetical protein
MWRKRSAEAAEDNVAAVAEPEPAEEHVWEAAVRPAEVAGRASAAGVERVSEGALKFPAVEPEQVQAPA